MDHCWTAEEQRQRNVAFANAVTLIERNRIRDAAPHLCFFCGGPAHPATGSQYTSRVIACGPCARSAWDWMRRHTLRRWHGVFFYEMTARRFS